MQISGHAVSIPARDGTPLAGTLFAPEGQARAALLVNSGTGVPRRFYGRFATYAAERGFAALTYDYRGVGDSAPAGGPRASRARYRDWGQRDIPGAIDWLAGRYPAAPLVAVGHSTGGQQLGLAPNVGKLQAAVFAAVSTGYWGGMPLHYQLFTLALWHGLLPVATRMLGYAPASKIGWGEDLPTGVAREWGAWCLQPDYMAAFFDETGRRSSPDGNPFGETHFGEARLPIRAYYATDDPIATRANAGPMLALYRAAEVETRWVAPADLDADEIGHLGFFRSDVGAPLWEEALGWLAKRAGVAEPAIRPDAPPASLP